MIQIFLSYARRDGLDAATKLRGELTAMGFAVWRDIEEMAGGLAWKEQLRAALRQVDAVLVLLTPGSVASQMVEWEWENALTLGKRVIGLLIAPCDVPDELKRLHYHDLSQPATYTLGLVRLARDLLRLAPAAAPTAPPRAAPTAPKFVVGTAVNSTVGDHGITVNQAGAGGLDAAAIARLVQTLRSQAPGDPAVQAEILAIVREMQPTLGDVAAGVRDLQAGQQRILARFDTSEQRILSPILARLDEQQAALLDNILDVLDVAAIGADELDRHLAVIDAALAEVNARAAGISDRSLVASSQQVAELASPLGLDAKHKLKVTIPIIPVLLSYEGAFELGSRLDLAEVWRALQNLVRS